MPRNLSTFFSPKSVAIIGASRNPKKVGGIVLSNIINSKFTGKIYPINPNAKDIGNIPCFPDIKTLPEVPDLVVIALPASLVLETLQQIGEKGIKNVVVFAAGFKETGEEGKKLEDQLKALAQKYQLNLLGPNCLGFVNNLCPINVTFGEPVKWSGNLTFISQSGAIAASLFDWCNSIGLGIDKFITLGNKADLNENDILEFFSDIAQQPIGLYLESISNGLEFIKIASHLSKKNPIFIIKPGKTTAAAQAMQSHTGAIAGEDDILNIALLQAGIIRCQTLEDFFDLAKCFAWQKIPLGPKVAIISNAGGPAVISADAVVSNGLELAQFDDQTKEKLSQVLPRTASFLNPVDVLGDALSERFTEATKIVLQNNQVDAIVIILTPQMMTEASKTAEGLGDLFKQYQKPIFCSFIGGSLITKAEEKLNQAQIPCFRFPERAVAALANMWHFRQYQLKDNAIPTTQNYQFDQTKIQAIIDNALKNNHKTLDNLEANNLVSLAGIPTPPTILPENLEQAKNFAQTQGYPVVLKLSAPGLLHKKTIGGVIAGISNETDLGKSWDALKHKISQIEGNSNQGIKIQIQKSVEHGVEVIIGIKKDQNFGKVMLFGAGGSLADLIADRNLHLLPLETSQARELVEKSKVFTILKRQDNEPPLALDQLYDIISRLGKLAQNLPEVLDIEINPLIVSQNRVWAIDSKVILEKGIDQPITSPKLQVAQTVSHTNLATTYHYFEFEQETPLNFEPGQYISVKVASDRMNCYSLAGNNTPNRFNLLVDVKPGGPGSRFFANLKVGDKITYLGPFGNFIFRKDGDAKKLLFLATGCGLAPLKPMIEAALSQNKSLIIKLYFGLNTPKDLFAEQYLSQLAENYPNFSYKIAIWKPDNTWKGYQGFITDLVKADITDASDTAAYLCGNKTMIEQASILLESRGMPKERIYTEKY